jgi:hypothetical protein
MKRAQKLTEDDLKRYERALILWEQGLKKETAELDAREAELEEREGGVGPVICRKSTTFRDIEDGCTITPEEFVTTLPECGMGCKTNYHTDHCQRMIYLEVERLGNL